MVSYRLDNNVCVCAYTHFTPFSAVHTTCYSDVLHSLLSCNNYYQEWQRKFGGGTRQADILSQERRRWSITSKSSRGLYLLDAGMFCMMLVPGTHVYAPTHVHTHHTQKTSSENSGAKASCRTAGYGPTA